MPKFEIFYVFEWKCRIVRSLVIVRSVYKVTTAHSMFIVMLNFIPFNVVGAWSLLLVVRTSFHPDFQFEATYCINFPEEMSISLLNDCGRYVFFMEIAFIMKQRHHSTLSTIAINLSVVLKPTENSSWNLFHVRNRLAQFLIKTIAHLVFMVIYIHSLTLHV